jgi:hypothetical protein
LYTIEVQKSFGHHGLQLLATNVVITSLERSHFNSVHWLQEALSGCLLSVVKYSGDVVPFLGGGLSLPKHCTESSLLPPPPGPHPTEIIANFNFQRLCLKSKTLRRKYARDSSALAVPLCLAFQKSLQSALLTNSLLRPGCKQAEELLSS